MWPTSTSVQTEGCSEEDCDLYIWRWRDCLDHTGKCIRRFAGIYVYCRLLPVLHRPEVVDIGVNAI